MNPRLSLALGSSIAALAAAAPIVQLTSDRTFIGLAVALVTVSAGLGIGARRFALAESRVKAIQLATVVIVPLLQPGVIRPVALLRATWNMILNSEPPMSYDPGFAVLTALCIWAIHLICEILTLWVRRPGLTFPILLLPFCVAAAIDGVQVSPLLFAVPATAAVLLLAVATGAGLPRPRRGRGPVAGAALATAFALTGSLALTAPLPESQTSLGSTNGVQLIDPSLDLIRNLRSPTDQRLLTYRTDTGEGVYLRLAALSSFTADGFQLVPTELMPRPLPTAHGPQGSRVLTTSIQITDFSSQWLPTPWVPTRIDASDDWRYDTATLALNSIGSNRNSATKGLRYQVTSIEFPEADSLLPDAVAGDPGDDGLTTQLPQSVRAELVDLANQVTAGATTAGEKALKLRTYLTSKRFTYSTQTSGGTTLSTLTDFLFGSRTGYCEQFAGAMAALSRASGIPARVVVGFLPGRKEGDHWLVSTRNTHAWTELYFSGLGWVALDSTPAGAVGRQTPRVRPSSSATPTRTPASSTAKPTVRPSTTAPTSTSSPTSTELIIPWDLWAGFALVILALGVLIFGPGAVRRRLGTHRRRRLTDPRATAERYWQETRAIIIDAGGSWPDSTPGRIAAVVSVELDPEGSAALAELANRTERARYAAEPATGNDPAALLGAVRASAERRWHGSRRLLDRWWPRSLRPSGLRRRSDASDLPSE